MKKGFYLVVILICLSGYNKSIGGSADISSSNNPAYTSFNQANLSVVKENPSESFGNLPYQIPDIKTADDFTYTIYIDPDYTGGNSDGSKSHPYTNLNDLYWKGGIPSNTAFLIKRGTMHPRIGRKSGVSPSYSEDMIWNNNFIGSYGTGDRPIVRGIWVAADSDGLTIRDLNVSAPSFSAHESFDIIINLFGGLSTQGKSSPKNITIAYNIIWGLHTPGKSWTSGSPYPYPNMGIRGGGENTVVYHNQIGNVGDNGVYLGGSPGLVFVRNDVSNVNRRQWGRGLTPEETNPGGHPSGGDGAMFVGNLTCVYIAGNYFDPARSYRTEHPDGYDFWKHSMLFKMREGVPVSKALIEWNTIIAPPVGTETGPAQYLDCEPGLEYRNNLIAPMRGQKSNTLIAGTGVAQALRFPKPYGIRDNHIIRRNPDTDESVVWPGREDEVVEAAGNLIFNCWDNYDNFLETNNSVGSDIDPHNFWEAITP